MGPLITQNLFEKALLEPTQIGAIELHVVSGYASPAMVTKHLEELRAIGVHKFSIDLLGSAPFRDKARMQIFPANLLCPVSQFIQKFTYSATPEGRLKLLQDRQIIPK
jgi:hypothetical protein